MKMNPRLVVAVLLAGLSVSASPAVMAAGTAAPELPSGRSRAPVVALPPLAPGVGSPAPTPGGTSSLPFDPLLQSILSLPNGSRELQRAGANLPGAAFARPMPQPGALPASSIPVSPPMTPNPSPEGRQDGAAPASPGIVSEVPPLARLSLALTAKTRSLDAPLKSSSQLADQAEEAAESAGRMVWDIATGQSGTSGAGQASAPAAPETAELRHGKAVPLGPADPAWAALSGSEVPVPTPASTPASRRFPSEPSASDPRPVQGDIPLIVMTVFRESLSLSFATVALAPALRLAEGSAMTISAERTAWAGGGSARSPIVQGGRDANGMRDAALGRVAATHPPTGVPGPGAAAPGDHELVAFHEVSALPAPPGEWEKSSAQFPPGRGAAARWGPSATREGGLPLEPQPARPAFGRTAAGDDHAGTPARRDALPLVFPPLLLSLAAAALLRSDAR